MVAGPFSEDERRGPDTSFDPAARRPLLPNPIQSSSSTSSPAKSRLWLWAHAVHVHSLLLCLQLAWSATSLLLLGPLSTFVSPAYASRCTIIQSVELTPEEG
jgi:hypothetical protein